MRPRLRSGLRPTLRLKPRAALRLKLRARDRAVVLGVVVWGLLLVGILGAPVCAQVAAHRLSPGALGAVPPAVGIACDVSSGLVFSGQGVVITTRVVEGGAVGLRYSFRSSAGRLTVSGANGNSARLDTSGIAAGNLSVTCVAVDELGRTVAQSKVIEVMKAQVMAGVIRTPPSALPPPPPPPPSRPLPQAQPASKTTAAAAAAAVIAAQIAEQEKVWHTGPAKGFPAKPQNALPAKADAALAPQPKTEFHPAPPNTLPPKMTNPDASKPTATAPTTTGSAAADGTNAGPDAGGEAYAEGVALQKWEAQLRTGKIEYNLPAKMSLPNASEVSVVVHGYEDVSGPVQAGGTSAPLKVSPRMRVVLSSEANPDEFKIEPDGTQEVQFVPLDGAATWRWKVTPKQPAANQKLTIRALLVYPDGSGGADVEITSYTAVVSVQVGSVVQWMKYLLWNDPLAFLQYVLPGGAGFAFVAGLVVWWWKRRHPAKGGKK